MIKFEIPNEWELPKGHNFMNLKESITYLQLNENILNYRIMSEEEMEFSGIEYIND